jgi:hypothetical protein
VADWPIIERRVYPPFIDISLEHEWCAGFFDDYDGRVGVGGLNASRDAGNAGANDEDSGVVNQAALLEQSLYQIVTAEHLVPNADRMETAAEIEAAWQRLVRNNERVVHERFIFHGSLGPAQDNPEKNSIIQVRPRLLPDSIQAGSAALVLRSRSSSPALCVRQHPETPSSGRDFLINVAPFSRSKPRVRTIWARERSRGCQTTNLQGSGDCLSVLIDSSSPIESKSTISTGMPHKSSLNTRGSTASAAPKA